MTPSEPHGSWVCPRCGTEHLEPPFCFAAGPPWPALVSPAEFEQRVELNNDLCVVDQSVFFMRGHIELPIVGCDTFVFSVWCSLSEASFSHAMDRWKDPSREGDGYFGWLCSSIPVYPSTLQLKLNVRSRAVGQVPLFEVQQCDHPLYLDQRDGISLDRARQIAHALLHGD